MATSGSGATPRSDLHCACTTAIVHSYLARAGLRSASPFKGADYEEATLLAVLLVLWRAGPALDRRAALAETRFSAGWIVAVVG